MSAIVPVACTSPPMISGVVVPLKCIWYPTKNSHAGGDASVFEPAERFDTDLLQPLTILAVFARFLKRKSQIRYPHVIS